MAKECDNRTRTLLATLTQEYFMPVRITYEVHDSESVERRLRALRCMAWVPLEGCWQWLYEAEAARLPIGKGYEVVPRERRPIVLGRIRFPERGVMTLQVNSPERAIEGARFFASCLGTGVLERRVRIVNRLFGADEGTFTELVGHLDRNVTVVHPSEIEEELLRDIEPDMPLEERRRIGMRNMMAVASRLNDVPPVEDFPLRPEEETPDFRDLSLTLRLRSVRAMEHWLGNTHVTLQDVITAATMAATEGAASPKGSDRSRRHRRPR